MAPEQSVVEWIKASVRSGYVVGRVRTCSNAIEVKWVRIPY